MDMITNKEVLKRKSEKIICRTKKKEMIDHIDFINFYQIK